MSKFDGIISLTFLGIIKLDLVWPDENSYFSWYVIIECLSFFADVLCIVVDDDDDDDDDDDEENIPLWWLDEIEYDELIISWLLLFDLFDFTACCNAYLCELAATLDTVCKFLANIIWNIELYVQSVTTPSGQKFTEMY